MKAIKRRITSVNSTKKIMKAMNLIAASRLQKSKARLQDIRPMYDSLDQVMDNIKAGFDPDDKVEFAEKREVNNICYIVLTSDRGLCGAYNANVSKEALSFINANEDKQEKIIALGSKAWEYFNRRDKNVIEKYPASSNAASLTDAATLSKQIAEMYTSGEVDEVYLAYSHFESIITHVPRVVKLLPVWTAETSVERRDILNPMTFDPDVNTFIKHAIPMYLNVSIYDAMIEASVCEHASRMTSMDSATRNATEIIEDLTLEYNRMRQGSITQEITEIVTGANALQ
jgi:F-type H+-transporting ATPase subunit gamma